jgi:predicted  nucleic acid-binding Zn-ribbon protein/microcystin-dependent protein
VGRQSRADVQRLDKELRSLQGSLQGLTKGDVQRLNTEFSSLRDSLQGVTKADLQRLNTELSSLRDSLQGVTKADVQRLNTELSSLRDSLQGVTTADVQGLGTELRSLRDSLQGVTKADVQRLNTELSSLRDSLSGRMKAELQRVEGDVASVGESLQAIKGENKGRVDELERHVSSSEEGLRPLQDELRRLKDQTENASKDLAEAKGQYGQAVQVIDDFRGITRNLDAIVTAKEAELKVLVKNLENNAGDFILQQMPIGSIVMWPIAEKPPAKWRICDGAPVTAQEAPEFCELLKDAYWTTGEAKVVHVPDLRGYFIRAADTRKVEDPEKVDEEAPREVGSKQRGKLPQHTHDVSDLRVAGGLWWQQDRNILLYQSQRKEQLKGGEDLRTLGGGSGAWNTYQLQRGETEVDSIALRGELGPMINEQGKVRPDNIALHFIIRIQR